VTTPAPRSRVQVGAAHFHLSRTPACAFVVRARTRPVCLRRFPPRVTLRACPPPRYHFLVRSPLPVPLPSRTFGFGLPPLPYHILPSHGRSPFAIWLYLPFVPCRRSTGGRSWFGRVVVWFTFLCSPPRALRVHGILPLWFSLPYYRVWFQFIPPCTSAALRLRSACMALNCRTLRCSATWVYRQWVSLLPLRFCSSFGHVCTFYRVPATAGGSLGHRHRIRRSHSRPFGFYLAHLSLLNPLTAFRVLYAPAGLDLVCGSFTWQDTDAFCARAGRTLLALHTSGATLPAVYLALLLALPLHFICYLPLHTRGSLLHISLTAYWHGSTATVRWLGLLHVCWFGAFACHHYGSACHHYRTHCAIRTRLPRLPSGSVPVSYWWLPRCSPPHLVWFTSTLFIPATTVLCPHVRFAWSGSKVRYLVS
jgi:hypothetical protein